MWFDSMDSIVRLLVVGILTYVAVIVVLRVSGARTLAKMNAFDFVVTVALGTVVASGFTTAGMTLARVVLALVVLVSLQWLVAWSSCRFRGVRQALTASPVLLVAHGRILHDRAEKARIGDDEIHQALRNSGRGGVELVAAAVLETDGSISVVGADSIGSGEALRDIPGWSTTTN